MEAEQRARIRRDYDRLLRIEKKEAKAADEKARQREAELQREAEARLAKLQERLKRLGIDDLFRTRVHTISWHDGHGWPEVDASFAVRPGRKSEMVLIELLDRLEKLL